jgi:hypothetical protein
MPGNVDSSGVPIAYDLEEYGIAEPIDLLGSVKRLLPGLDVPVVFLMDEYHGTGECVDQNVCNARNLILKARVNLVGVESHSGGQEWDDYDCIYKDSFDNGDNRIPVNTCPAFADRMTALGTLVLGVECHGMLNNQHVDFDKEGDWSGKAVKEHPLNQERSRHFIRTLFQFRSRRCVVGNLILNAGSDHNSHIEQWIQDRSIEEIAGEKAAYVRLQAPACRGTSP